MTKLTGVVLAPRQHASVIEEYEIEVVADGRLRRSDDTGDQGWHANGRELHAGPRRANRDEREKNDDGHHRPGRRTARSFDR